MIKKILTPLVLLVALFSYSSLYCQSPNFYDCYENSKADCNNCGELEQKQLTVDIQIDPVGGWNQEGCKNTKSDYCKYKVGDIINIMGGEFVIIGAQQTDCFTNCDPDYD